jgi:nucleoside-diphosphate-sugar epimerase
MSEKILVTGASGFIAGHCIVDLLANGYQVRGTVRSLDKVPQLRAMFAKHTDKAAEIEFAQAELLSADGWSEAAMGCDGLFHVASPIPVDKPKDPNEVILPAKEGTLNALTAAKEQGIKRVVLTSSAAAMMFGHKDKDREFTEQDWTNLAVPNLPAYFQSKTIAERAAWDFVKDSEINLSTINPGIVFGPALGKDCCSSLHILSDILRGKFPLIPKIGFELVDVRDVATLHRLAYESPDAIGQRFLCANGFMSLKEVVQLLNKEFPTGEISSREMPNFLFAILSRFLTEMEMFKDEANKIKTANISAAKSIGWQPRSAEDAIIAGARSLVDMGIVKI